MKRLPQNGQGKGRHAAKASDLWIRVPPGTVVRDQEGALCGELIQDGDELLVVRGGRGGRGNEAFKTNRNTAPKFAEKGEMQINKWLLLELKVYHICLLYKLVAGLASFTLPLT